MFKFWLVVVVFYNYVVLSLCLFILVIFIVL